MFLIINCLFLVAACQSDDDITDDSGVVDINSVDNPNSNNNDIQAIIAFLEALDDPDFDRTIPTTVPSGLNPGGNINNF